MHVWVDTPYLVIRRNSVTSPVFPLFQSHPVYDRGWWLKTFSFFFGVNEEDTVSAIKTNTSMAFVSSFAPSARVHVGNRSSSCELLQSRRMSHEHKRAVISGETRRWMMRVGILYTSVSRATSEVADLIQTQLGSKAAEPADIADIDVQSLESYEALVVGSPTYNTNAEDNRTGTPWDDFLYGDLNKANLNGKPVAVYGVGDAVGYPKFFCDAIEELHDRFQSQGCRMIGYTPSDSVEYESSKAVRDDHFLGLALDTVNEGADTSKRVNAWCDQIASEAGI